ncbi:helix-turn-helix transcriptional regulator [Geothrix sp. PMB-07]|uniref:helix-turn-helix domain-containing protein n=1 Tax=Geothrix sp. PMB-07 TaxID=3068640 RepID=UPI002741299D|nr:helix-turn-helix transcriptional regulator [Geothrix sp. PMB-07]WLT32840.1 helix-turn-helix transcriptional regulator [Geothrix sp. PMB-07]
MADELGVGASVYSQWETGKPPLRKPNALAIQAVFGYRWEWLMTGEGPRKVQMASGSYGLISIPILEVFQGKPVRNDTADVQAFKRRFLEDLVSRAGAGSVEDLYLFEVTDNFNLPFLGEGSLALVNPAVELRQSPVAGGLYLVRRGPSASKALIRRVFHGDSKENGPYLLLSTSGLNGVIVPLKNTDICEIVLGHVGWYTSPESAANPLDGH